MNEVSKDVEKFEDRGDIPSAVVISDPNSPAALTRLALSCGQSLADIEKMLELQIKYEENEARKAYFDAVANFKAEAPRVTKDKYNKWFESWYTSLGNLLDTYNPILGKHGLSISFPILSVPEQAKGSMTVECKLSHAMGHSESISMTSPIDQAAIGKSSGQRSRTPIQDIKTTFTYLRSATCEAILGVAGSEAGSADNDGNTTRKQPEVKCINEAQVKTIESLMIRTDINTKVFFKSLKVIEIKELPAKGFSGAMNILNARLKNMRQPGEEG